MVARHFTELECWQLARALKLRVYEVLARPQVAADFKFCDQIRESSRSGPRNIAEGYGKYDPPEFARYLRIAKGSLTETQNHLLDGFDRSYLSRAEFQDLDKLARRARSAVVALIRYLESCPRKWRRPRHQAPTPPEGSRKTERSTARARSEGGTEEPGTEEPGTEEPGIEEPGTEEPEPGNP